jgi:hypothetical protein
MLMQGTYAAARRSGQAQDQITGSLSKWTLLELSLTLPMSFPVHWRRLRHAIELMSWLAVGGKWWAMVVHLVFKRNDAPWKTSRSNGGLASFKLHDKNQDTIPRPLLSDQRLRHLLVAQTFWHWHSASRCYGMRYGETRNGTVASFGH